MKLLKNSFFRICAFLGILFASSIPVAAQGDEIYEVPGINSKKSIVRYWKGMEYIVYTEDGSTSSFSLVDYSSMSCATFSSASYLGVNDFEIAVDSVFFCGFDGTIPIFGYFDIFNLFSTATGLNTISLGGWFPSSLSGQERISNLMKLEAQLIPPNYCHVYMIGKAEYLQPGYPVRQNRCIVDMRKIGTTWDYQFSQEHGSTYYYDDVVITNNFVEVVGHKNGSSGYYNTRYVPPTSVTFLIPSSPYTVTYYHPTGNTCYSTDPYRPEMATHLFGDYYALVSYANVCVGGIVDRGTVLSIFNGSPNCVYRYFIPQGFLDTADWEFKDFRYNKYTKELYLLQEMSNPVSSLLNSVICEFDVGAGGAISSAHAYHQPGIPYFSLDQCDSYNGAVSVGGIAPIRLWHHFLGEHCVEKTNLPFVSMSNENDFNSYIQYPITSKCAPNPVSGRLEHYEIIKICE